MLLVECGLEAQTAPSIRDAVLGDTGQATPEVSTAELIRILAQKSATVLDARPYAEYAIGHIPGAVNVAPKPGVAPSAYVSDVAEIGRLVHQDHSAPLVLYCNGPQCGKSKRLAKELVAAGYTNVRRYQLGLPVWRALGGVCRIEAAGLQPGLDHPQLCGGFAGAERATTARRLTKNQNDREELEKGPRTRAPLDRARPDG